jgi:CHAD domain-containing protein
MPLDQKLSARSFDKLKRQISKLKENSAPESVHRFRTCARRVEVLLAEFTPEPSGNERKLLKQLAKLRKKAGKVRDLDVQTGLLRNLRSPQAAAHKTQLQRVLTGERARREKKLQKSLDKDTIGDIRKRVRRAAREFAVAETMEPLSIARGLLNQVHADGAITEEMLHQYRIAGKRARYVAELAGDSDGVKALVAQLRSMQDGIGDWHDWLQLTERAEQLFGGIQDSSLVAQLRNVTRAKYREAVRVLGVTKAALGVKPIVTERRVPERMGKISSAA